MEDLDRIRANLATVRDRVAAAAERSGRRGDDVRLIAVTKGVAPDRIEAALAAGVGDVGENRVAEAEAKRAVIRSPARWHLIGHLQSNKAARAAALFDVVHSLDSERISRRLAAHRDAGAAALPVLIEVELTGIAARTGVTAAEAATLIPHVDELPGVRLAGLMTIAPPGDPETARPYFQRLHRLRDSLQDSTAIPLPELSMGMSADFTVAVEEGATMVRVGRAITAAAR